MRGKFIHRATLGATAAATIALTLAAGPAQAALQGRDLNGDTVVDGFYDTDLDITWLRDANVNGAMLWGTAVAWAEGFSIGGYSGWRLPTSDTCSAYNCTDSEMGHLWYVELGNTAGAFTNTGKFQNLQSYPYWSGTEYAPDPKGAWNFNISGGYQNSFYKNDNFLYAMAVHPGDVGAVPEPQTDAMLLVGLSVLAIMRRQRR